MVSRKAIIRFDGVMDESLVYVSAEASSSNKRRISFSGGLKVA